LDSRHEVHMTSINATGLLSTAVRYDDLYQAGNTLEPSPASLVVHRGLSSGVDPEVRLRTRNFVPCQEPRFYFVHLLSEAVPV
jgi:hypothetical protein